MSTLIRNNVNYGFNQPLNSEIPQPIIANRAPTANDKAPLGQEWVYTTANEVYFLSSVVANSANWVLVSSSGGSGVFSSLTVNPGPTNLSTVGNGTVTIGNGTNTGDIDITGGAGDLTISATGGGDFNLLGGAGPFIIDVGTGNLEIDGNGNSISIGNDAAANTILIGTQTGAAQTQIRAGTGGISMITAGLVEVSPAVQTIASPTVTSTINARVCKITATGFTTAAAANVTFTLNSTLIGASSAILVNVSNLNISGNNAQMAILGMKQGVGSMILDVINNGAGALGAGDNIIITAWILL